MKKIKFFVVFLLLIRTAAFAQTEGDFTVTLTRDNTGAIITKYNGSVTAVSIPATIQGMPVREIGEQAFARNSNITNIIIPEGVTSINSNDYILGAFAGCVKLVSVALPASLVRIGNRAFINCSALQEIIIPEGVTVIGEGAFAGCRSLKIVTLPISLKRIGRYAFSYEYQNLVVPNIDKNSAPIFSSITLPVGLEEINDYAFMGSRTLTSIVLPDSVTTIAPGVFANCTALESVTLPSTISRIGSAAFQGCTALSVITIPDSVEEIIFSSDGASFKGNDKLTLASQAALRRRGYTGKF